MFSAAEGAGDVEEDADFVEVAAAVVGESCDAGELAGGLSADDPGVEDEAFVCGEGLEEVGVGEVADEIAARDGAEVGEGEFGECGGETHRYP